MSKSGDPQQSLLLNVAQEMSPWGSPIRHSLMLRQQLVSSRVTISSSTCFTKGCRGIYLITSEHLWRSPPRARELRGLLRNSRAEPSCIFVTCLFLIFHSPCRLHKMSSPSSGTRQRWMSGCSPGMVSSGVDSTTGMCRTVTSHYTLMMWIVCSMEDGLATRSSMVSWSSFPNARIWAPVSAALTSRTRTSGCMLKMVGSTLRGISG